MSSKSNSKEYSPHGATTKRAGLGGIIPSFVAILSGAYRHVVKHNGKWVKWFGAMPPKSRVHVCGNRATMLKLCLGPFGVITQPGKVRLATW